MLNLIQNPYLIEYNPQVVKAINLAIAKGLFSVYNIKPAVIENYKSNKEPIPIWVLGAVCNLNSTDYRIPIIYQNLWFCLHNILITRIQPSGKKFKTKVQFSPSYIKLDKKLKKLVIKALNKISISERKFSLVCGYKSGSIRLSKKKIPITAILKVCQILGLNIWELLAGYELFGKTNFSGKIIIPKNKRDTDIDVLLIWLKTEGHLYLGNTTIEINQKNNIKSLEKLKSLINKKFNLKNINPNFFKGARGEDRLIISSGPLRQLLCLKYNLPLGYKTGSLGQTNFERLRHKDYLRIMASFMQTEGCLSHHYTRNKKKILPRFEFIVKDLSLAKDCDTVLRKLNFKPTFLTNQNLFKVGLYRSKEVIRLINLTKKHFFNLNKVRNLKEVCSIGIGL